MLYNDEKGCLVSLKKFLSNLRFNKISRFIEYIRKKHPRKFLAFKFIFIFGLFYALCISKLDPDFGWHLRDGFYFRQYGIPSHDIYTYTASNFHWIAFEWGNDVIDSYIYGWGSYIALALLFSLIWTLSLFVNNKSKNFLVLFIATLAIAPYSGIRAIAWTVLAFSILMRLSSSKNKYLRLLIPFLFIAWANIHAGFIAGLFFLFYLAISKKSFYWLKVFLICILATFINPYGPGLYEEIIRTLSTPSLHTYITEWHYFYILPPSILYGIFWGVGFSLYDNKKIKNLLRLDTLLAYSALDASRNVPLFVIGSINHTNEYVNNIYHSFPKKIDKIGKIILITLTFFFIILTIVSLNYSFQIGSLREANFPVQGVAYLQKHNCKGRVFNDYDYGGYIIWKLPNSRVFIDGRMPTWKNTTGKLYMDQYLSVLNNKKTQNKIFKEYNIQCVLVPYTTSFQRLIFDLKSKGWNKVNSDNKYVLLVNK